MDPLFQVHMLNQLGKYKAEEIAAAFDRLLTRITQPPELTGVMAINIPEGRELSLVRTHLEIACFYAKKALATQAEFQQDK